MEQDYNEKHWSNPCPKYDCREAACKCGLKYVNIPASLGDDSEGSNVAPKNGAYCNALVIYEANNHVYIYSKEGVPTLIDVDASDISTLEQEVRKAQKDIVEFREDIDRFAYFFDTVADMKASPKLTSGDYVKTLGYYEKDDGGGAYYKVRSSIGETTNDMDLISLQNLCLAEFVPTNNQISVKQFGAKGDKVRNDLPSIQGAIDYARENGLYKVHVQNGDYLVNGPISVYSRMTFEGEDRSVTRIFKSGHTKDSVNNVDCIITVVKDPDESTNYPTNVEIRKMSIQSNDSDDPSDYGLYIYTSSHIMIENFSSRRTKTQIYLGDMWLSSLRHIYCALGEIGIETRNGTTLSMDDIYVDYESVYGYNIRGLSYSTFNNIACDYANNSIPYYFYYSTLVVNALGCEATNYTQCVYVRNATVQLNCPRIHAGTSNPDQVVFYSQLSQLIINNLCLGSETGTNDYAGKLLNIGGNGSHVVFIDPKLLGDTSTKFLNTITGNQNNTVTLIDGRDIVNIRPENGVGGIGMQTNALPDGFAERAGIVVPHSLLSYPVSGGLNTLPDGTSVAWANDNRPSGAIIPNMAMNKSGTMMYIKTTYDTVTPIVNPVASATVSGDNMVLTFSSIQLDSTAESNGFKMDSNWTCRKVGETAWKAIDSVDYDNNTITVVGTSGFAEGDYIEVRPPFYVRNIQTKGIQGILIGDTASRPVSPTNGTMYYDTTLDKPIWRVGNNWKDSTGATV